MDAFSYLAVLFSVVLGLALTQILQGLRTLMLARNRVQIYWPQLVWAALLSLIVAQDWWSMFGMRFVHDWTFAMYAIVLLQVTLIYMTAALALPEIERDGTVDMRKSYFEHARWFFGLLAAAVVVSPMKDLVFNVTLPSVENLIFHLVFLVTVIIAALTQSRRYHSIAAPFIMAVFVAYIVLLFAKL